MRIAFLMLCLWWTMGLGAQNAATEAYQAEPIAEKSFESSEWERLRKNMRYEDQALPEEEPEEEENTEIDFNIDTETEPTDFTGFAQFVLLIITILVLAGVLYWMIANKAFKKNTKVERIKVASLEEAERDLDKADLELFLEQAIAAGDYRLALRLYYLRSIQLLSQKRLIIWKRDKTNGRYLQELKGSHFYEDFKTLTLDFERIWYTDMAVSQNLFQQQRSAFEPFLEEVAALKKPQKP